MRALSPRSAVARLGAACLLAAMAACTASPAPRPAGADASSTARPEGPRAAAAGLARALRDVEVVDEITWRPGYDRSCDPGACVFGAPWTDDHDGPAGDNGCDTRQDVLLRQMRDIELRWGSRCRIYEARLTDPYTGEELTWRDDGYWIAIDHVYPLARAWHGGAWAWSQRRRIAFANDVRRELLAVTAATNDAKGAAGPAEWLPPHRPFRCSYVRRYVAVAAHWGLPLTDEDVAAVRRAC